MSRKSGVEIIAMLLVFIFLYTALSKLFDLQSFRFSLGQSPILRHFYKPVSIGLPLLEILVVAVIIVPKYRLIGLYASAGLLVVFTVYLTAMVLFDSHLPCGCGGVISMLTWKQHIFLNLVLSTMAIFGTILQRRQNNTRQFASNAL